MTVPVFFATASDGNRVAYTEVGSGLPLLFPSTPGGAPFEQWAALPDGRGWLDAIRCGRRCITFDFRGHGLSGPIREPLTTDQLESDLSAVVAAAGRRVDLFALYSAVPSAVRFAANHPEQLRSLTLGGCGLTLGGLWNFKGTKEDVYLPTHYNAVRANWDFSSDKECWAFARETVRLVPYRAYVELSRVTFGVPVSADLARTVRVPTLCVQADEGPPMGSELANVIPGATLAVLDVGNSIAARSGSAVGAAIAEFLARLGFGPSSPNAFGSEPIQQLSPREIEVLELLAQGGTNRGIAAKLCLSNATVDRHVANIYAKLGIHRRAEAVSIAVRHGLDGRSPES